MLAQDLAIYREPFSHCPTLLRYAPNGRLVWWGIGIFFRETIAGIGTPGWRSNGYGPIANGELLMSRQRGQHSMGFGFGGIHERRWARRCYGILFVQSSASSIRNISTSSLPERAQLVVKSTRVKSRFTVAWGSAQ